MSAHSNIVILIREVSEILNPTGRFIYGREIYSSFDYYNSSNADSNEANAKPLISLLPFKVVANPTSEYRTANIAMMFSRSAGVDDTAEREEEIINEMSTICESFINILMEANEKPIQFATSNFNYGAEYQFWMGTSSGVALTFTINYLDSCLSNGDVTLINQFRNRNQEGGNGNGGGGNGNGGGGNGNGGGGNG